MKLASIASNDSYKVERGWDLFRAEFRRATRVVESSIQAPVLIVNTMQLGVTILSACPSVNLNLDTPRQLCKDVKNILNILKGMKAIDGTLYFKKAWKLIVLNISGISLTVLSTICFIDRFKIMNVSVVKIGLAALPIIGILPYGGLITISTIGLLSMNILLNFDKKSTLEDEVKDIKDKRAFWLEFDQAKIQQRIAKYLNGDQNKLQKWTVIQKNWSRINPEALEQYRRAKANKWQTKLDRTELNQTSNVLSITANMAVVSKQVFALATVVAGLGIIALPIAVGVGMDLVSASCDSSNFFLKRYISRIEYPAIELENYVQVAPMA